MLAENKRRHDRVDTNVKVRLPGDATWTESKTSDVSVGGLFFESAKQLNQGELVNLQFMLQRTSGTLTNVHFFAPARILRVIPKDGIYKIAVEFIVDAEMRKEILKLVETIKSQNLKLKRPSIIDTLLQTNQSKKKISENIYRDV
ncbi:MAG TPA: PilZ domain-containing protein [Dissulfurispiraceae bacterium]|nr:PilZ domain-containing protein [Dissulfurispiraceae bacterium]